MGLLRDSWNPIDQYLAWTYFISNAQTKGAWDYKNTVGPAFEPYGNWHFGVMSGAFGMSERFALSGAGTYQLGSAMLDRFTLDRTPTPFGQGIPFLISPYGDLFPDSMRTRNGFHDYQRGYRGTYGATGSW